MDCCTINEKNYDSPDFAGTFRLLLGILSFFAGLYIAMFTEIHGHGLGFLLIFSAPFWIFKDGK